MSWMAEDKTKELVKEISDAVIGYREAWSGGAFTEPTVEASAMKNANALGKVEGLEEVLILLANIGKEND